MSRRLARENPPRAVCSLTPLFSCSSALSCVTKHSQLLYFQSFPHSFPCNGEEGVISFRAAHARDSWSCKFGPLLSTTSTMLLPQPLSLHAFALLPGGGLPPVRTREVSLKYYFNCAPVVLCALCDLCVRKTLRQAAWNLKPPAEVRAWGKIIAVTWVARPPAVAAGAGGSRAG